ncbi:hypothetical protein [Flaviaesturariibacter aridisoli]|uniref:DUF1795 domain-containing protein n=1 Tax=Flaviaesturariibacter aridisoli TaxID=2545761 RepID=A0A4R4DZQ0_9BACT|nr:hypothetical protein [Flaviaesturariibacter aridisoli]TCZ72204.1 hypothetical protein E0486_08920 [Flaviaesturariibacter aridisoli]
MYKNQLLTLLFALIGLSAGAQEANDLFVPEFNWKIRIPAGYTRVSQAGADSLSEGGEEMIEKHTGITINTRPKDLFTFRNGPLHYIEANYLPRTTNSVKEYEAAFRKMTEVVYTTFEKQFSAAAVDTATGTEVIAGMRFYALRVQIKAANGFVLRMHLYTRLVGERDLTVTFLSIDKDRLEELLNAFRTSTFGATAAQGKAKP